MSSNGNPRRKKTKVVDFQQKVGLRPNIGLIIFGIILIYLCISVIIYLNTNHIERYEVREGSLTISNVYTGIALRKEKIVNNPTAGYMNFFLYDGERTAVGDLVYTVDETGRLDKISADSTFEESKLTDRELREFRSEIINYMHSFRETDFTDIYDFKRSLKNTVAKINNANLLKSLEELSGTDVINYCYSPYTGVISYWTDGLEGYLPEDLTEDDFKKTHYEKKQIIGEEIVEKDVPAYKVCTDEVWNIVIPIEAQRGAELEAEGYVKVRFLKNQYESWAATKMVYGKDGNTYLNLELNNSMVTFVSDRFLDIELIVEAEKGLKIPLTAVVEKEFFLLEESYLIDEGRKGKRTVLRQCYREDGSIDQEKLTVDIYSYDEDTGKYYVDASILRIGDILYQLSGETDVVRERAVLIGVYNINKGYADFREINILYQNDEYAIVKSGTEFGLKTYDYIVLNADSVQDQQFINQ